jgi:hypothetical protein
MTRAHVPSQVTSDIYRLHTLGNRRDRRESRVDAVKEENEQRNDITFRPFNLILAHHPNAPHDSCTRSLASHKRVAE